MEPVPGASTEILFLCLARDCERNLPRFFAFLRNLRSAGVSCRAIVGENGSRDGTRATLLAAANEGVALLDTGAMAAMPHRLSRMAAGREMLLEAARRIPSTTFVGIADLDGPMQHPPAIPAVLAALEQLRQRDGLFAIGATSHPYFYDLLALRAPGHDFATLNAGIAAAKRRPLTYFRFQQRRLYLPQKALTLALPEACTSSFNGFCLYKAADYLRGTYRADDEAETCEHVTMNLTLATLTGKHMRIAPGMAVRTPADHTPVGFARFWYDRLRKAL